MEDIPPSVQSMARHPIYEGAREIVLMEWVDDRRAELLKVPEKIRCHVAAEVKRLWPMRSALLEEQAAKKPRHR